MASELPTDRNDLKGEATIITSQGAFMDASKYNAIGIPAIEGAQDGNPNSLNLGGPEAEYRGCPNILTLNHFFDGANVVTHGHTVVGRVTLGSDPGPLRRGLSDAGAAGGDGAVPDLQ